MSIIYNLIIGLSAWVLIPISWFSPKIKLFLNGRKNTFKQLNSIKKTDKVIWFHCASLGEFEQGRPIIETFKQLNTDYKIVLTFFSPSGYEIRKNYKHANVVCYLPLDTRKNMRLFLNKVHPEMAVFIKYEFWPNILSQLKKQNIETILVSGIFRSQQRFFKKGITSSFFTNTLKAFNHFFVQDTNSKELLNKIGFKNITISGDTRFDSVYNISKQNNEIAFIKKFTKNKTIVVAGSTWQKDEVILVNYINNHLKKGEKFIIAPHQINTINSLKNSINKKVCLYTDTNKNASCEVLIIDTIGILTKVYSYATIAYVGGGFGLGIHNILEPATFGVPIFIGPKYNKFNEAKALIAKKGCFVVRNSDEFVTKLKNQLLEDKPYKAGIINKNFIKINTGATNCIISYIKKNMLNFVD